MAATPNVGKGGDDIGQAVAEAPAAGIVAKPVPPSQHQDPRKYEIEQMVKRYSAKQSTLQNGSTNLTFRMYPSDPDFPFELDFLECEVRVPASYPGGAPLLRVKNLDIPRGFSVNIEKGWDGLVQEKPSKTLLALTNVLDKKLELFLSQQKTDTVTLVSFKDTRHLDAETTGHSSAPASAPEKARKRYVPEDSFSNDQIAQAKARRALETRQMESRMGRTSSVFQKSADGIVYTLPLDPKRRDELPAGLRLVQSVQMIIPLLYPLQALRILINDVESKDAEPLEEAFATRATQQQHLSLMGHLNYLTQHMHSLAKAAEASQSSMRPSLTSETNTVPVEKETDDKGGVGRDKDHIHVIPRPPEWYAANDSEESDGTDEDSDSEEGSEDSGATVTASASAIGPSSERGTSMSFPAVELHNIELLQVALLSVSVKCGRCRTVNEMTGLRPGLEKVGSCKKCAAAFSVTFRQELVHQNAVRAGFLDLSGCSISDMLPSTFVPTCAKCSTPAPGLVSVRGEVTTNVCRECHGKFTFKIAQVKFLAISPGSQAGPSSGPKRRQEKLGLHAGEELPQRGACTHYKRSYRWFRFSCVGASQVPSAEQVLTWRPLQCSKVHPCDQCHDAGEDHAHEWAKRMICGWCSREQNYAVEACSFCGRSVIGRKGRGFWEGGKGTRDRTMMSRKDKRKFRRVGGGEAKNKKKE